MKIVEICFCMILLVTAVSMLIDGVVGTIILIKEYHKHKKYKTTTTTNTFKIMCPNVRCVCCDYHYFDESGESHCQLYEQLGMATKKPTTGDGKES